MEVTHKRIVDAVVAHDAESARQALLDDIDRAHEAILDNIMEEDSEILASMILIKPWRGFPIARVYHFNPHSLEKKWTSNKFSIM